MAKLQNFKRIIVEDFKQEDRDLVSKLAYAINTFADDVITSFNKNITLTDNLACSKKTFTITVDSSGKPLTSASIKTDLSTQCSGVQVIKAVNNTNSAHVPTSCPFISFTNTSGSIIISNVSGLQAREEYTLTVLLWPTV